METCRTPRPSPLDLHLRGASAISLRATLVGDRTDLLFAHGFGQTRQSWLPSQLALAEHEFGSLSFDMRGHGQSARNDPAIRYEGEQFVADIEALVADCGQAKPILVGASMGGLTGLIAQARSRCFSALVLVDITARWEAAGIQRIIAFMSAHPDGFDSFEHAANEIAAYLPHRRERKTPEQLRHQLQRSPDGRLRWHWDPRLLQEFIPHSENLQDEIDAAARSIDVPVLLLSGGRSDVVSDATIAHFLELVPHARHMRLPQATHMLAGDDNHAFTRALSGFLTESGPAPRRSSGAVT